LTTAKATASPQQNNCGLPVLINKGVRAGRLGKVHPSPMQKEVHGRQASGGDEKSTARV
jgi:hypothetical protein